MLKIEKRIPQLIESLKRAGLAKVESNSIVIEVSKLPQVVELDGRVLSRRSVKTYLDKAVYMGIAKKISSANAAVYVIEVGVLERLKSLDTRSSRKRYNERKPSDNVSPRKSDEVEELRGRVSELEAELKRKEREISALKKCLSELQMRIAELEREKSKITQKMYSVIEQNLMTTDISRRVAEIVDAFAGRNVSIIIVVVPKHLSTLARTQITAIVGHYAVKIAEVDAK